MPGRDCWSERKANGRLPRRIIDHRCFILKHAWSSLGNRVRRPTENQGKTHEEIDDTSVRRLGAGNKEKHSRLIGRDFVVVRVFLVPVF